MDTAAPTVDPMMPQPVRVLRRRRDAPMTWTLDLELPAGVDAWRFEPGQFNMLYLPGVGEIPVSLSGDPADAGRLVHTVRAVGRVSQAITDLKPGDLLGLRGPFGTSWPMEAAYGRDVVLVAGGLGLPPLRPALYRLLGERTKFGRAALLYGTRSPSDILFLNELETWRRRLDIEVEVTVDHAPPDWRGNVGVVTTLIPRVAFDPDDTIAMMCGPELMMRFAAAALRDGGVQEDAIYLSMERNMKCAIGHCGHCQFGAPFVCRDGPVIRYDRIRRNLALREI
jgi:NAD(P)H-flavin reductase